MKKIIYAITITLALISFNANSASKMIFTKVGSVDVKNKKVTIDGKTYPYQMITEDSFYQSNFRAKSLKLLSKVKKYYVKIEFDTNTKDPNEMVVYIGEVQNAF